MGNLTRNSKTSNHTKEYMNLPPDESISDKEPVILDFYEGWVIQAIEGLRKEKDPTKAMPFVKKMEDGLTCILTYRGFDVANEVIKKYNLDKEFGVRLNSKGR